MNILEIANNQSFSIDELKLLSKEEFYSEFYNILKNNNRLISILPIDRSKPNVLSAFFLNNEEGNIKILLGDFPELIFNSFANEFPHTNYFECELSEEYGYEIKNHPWLRPVRKQNRIFGNKDYNFFKIDGEEIHEVAVGPIHAGVIEPGHFRFQCHGENVYNLEINLGYQHRGVEKLILKSNSISNKRILLTESIAGDTVIGHVNAHTNLIESLSGARLNLRIQAIRGIASEIERISMHLAGLGGISNDIGFALPASSYGRLRTLSINSLAELSGSRFGRGLFTYAGVNFDFNDKIINTITKNLLVIQNDIKFINDYFFTSVGALSRLEETGIVKKEFAQEIGMVGLAARASGLNEDIRINFPYGIYQFSPISLLTLSSGDVFARARLRALEIDESIKFVYEQLENLPEGDFKLNINELKKYSGAVSITEGWRGEIVHIAFTDADGKLIQYKIKDPSFNNWYGLSLALRNTPISDFPLCNKSFDLSYSGHDL